jgi:hypothetical protein
MWTYDKALSVVRACVDALTDGRGIVLDERTIDRPYGWVFFYQNRGHLGAHDSSDAFGGNAPIIFNRCSGEYRLTGAERPTEEYLEEYEQTLPATQLHTKHQLRQRVAIRVPARQAFPYETVLSHVRGYSNDSVPYDVVGVAHLLLAALDNLTAHWMDSDFEDLARATSADQRHHLIAIAEFLRTWRDSG